IDIYAYPRRQRDEVLDNAPICLTKQIKGDFLYWDIPDGCWRIFFFYKSRRGTHQTEYMHLIDEASVKVLLEAVYEPHYAHFKEYFGRTIAGFFSDEPSLGNTYISRGDKIENMYEFKIGIPNLALPWSDKLYDILRSKFGENASSLLAGL